MRCHAMKFSTLALALFVADGLVTVFTSPARAQWRYSAYLQQSAGDYIYSSTARNYYLTQGLQYRHERWSFEMNMSFAARNGDSLVVSGGGMISGSQSGHETMNLGLGDVFVRANYTLALQRNEWPTVTLAVLAKIPTASAARGLGTGEWDAGIFLSLARFANNFYISTEVGYLWLGDPAGTKYEDPVSYAVGLGRTLADGRLGLLVLYSGTGKIFPAYEAPQQIGMGVNWRSSNRLHLFTNIAGGLSETVPDRSFSFGISTAL